MDDKRPGEEHEQIPPAEESPAHIIKMKTFSFIMLVFLLIIATAGLTVFALTFGDDKAVEVNSPERREFEKLYTAYDRILDARRIYNRGFAHQEFPCRKSGRLAE